MSIRRWYEDGIATGRRYAREDLHEHLGTGGQEIILREEAKLAVERKDISENFRAFAALQLGVIRGYREAVR